VFKDELGELQSIVAREVVIEIRCPEEVRPLRFLGRPGELKSRTESITFSTLSSEQTRELYLECLLEEAVVGEFSEIADVEVRYADPDSSAGVVLGVAPIVVGDDGGCLCRRAAGCSVHPKEKRSSTAAVGADKYRVECCV